jgi:hypothetical protein
MFGAGLFFEILIYIRSRIRHLLGKRGDAFWDSYPDLELGARQFVFEECSKKEASFTDERLAKFIDDRFYELNNMKKIDPGFVRSVHSCRPDLRRFEAKFTANIENNLSNILFKMWIISIRSQMILYHNGSFQRHMQQFYYVCDHFVLFSDLLNVRLCFWICLL